MTTKKITQLCGIQKFFTIAMLLFLCLSLFGNTLHAATKNTTTYYHVNLQGTPIAASDESGAVKWSQSYSSYGYHGENTEQINDKGPTSFGFGSHVEDQYDDKLLVYMQGRYYDPALGRFLSVDPVGFNESNPASFNRYIYGNNNPHKYVDPDGQLPIMLVYWGVTAALSAYDTYSAFQQGGVGSALAHAAVDIPLSIAGGVAGKFVLRGGKLAEHATKVAKKTTESGIGVTRHGVQQKINRQVRSADELAAIKNPLEVKPIKTDSLGRPSQRSIGRKAEVVRNPETGDIVSVNPTSTKKAERLLRKLEGQ